MLDNSHREGYCLISKLEEDDWGYYNTIEQDYITINK